jgi:predicted nucleic acid-binding protein
MNGRSFLVDTNIALYLLGGDVTITNILDNSTIYLSFITQLELLGYSGISSSEQKKVKSFINDCVVVDITEDIKIKTITIRQNYKLKLPDCIIAATAQFLDIPLLTADKDFMKIKNFNITFYED